METLQERIFADTHDDDHSIFDNLNDEEKKIPSILHGWIQMNLTQILRARIAKEYVILPTVTFKTTERGYTPDLCVYRSTPALLDPLDLTPNANIPPLLAVEIVSSSQNNAELIFKSLAMLTAGVETCWIVEPPTGVVIICDKNGRTVLRQGDFLHHPLLSDPISLDEIFDLSV
jgi:Uma2 family endonuclease